MASGNDLDAPGLIVFTGTGLTRFADVLSRASDFVSYTIVTVDGDTNVWIIGQTPATLSASNFAFG